MLASFKGKKPIVRESAFVHNSAELIGDVTLEKNASVWCCASIRADLDSVSIGENSNVQDNCSLHVDIGHPVVLGKNVTVGHNAVLHGCAIGENTLVGIGAIVLNNARIGKNCIIGAGAVVTENTTIPDNSLVVGVPAKILRQVSAEQAEMITKNAIEYVALKKEYEKKKK